MYREFVFRLRIKQEVYNNEPKIRITVLSATPMDYAAEAKALSSKLGL